jgi:hypothetical protein
MNRLFLCIASLLSAATFSFAQSFEFYPGAQYDPNIPTPKSYLGYEIGEYFTDHLQMEGYIHALADAAPQRVKVLRIGQSNERRNMYLVVISSPENMQKLEEYRAAVARLRDPRATNPTEARRIAADTPVIAWMNYANDGNESAAFEAAIQVAYHFAAGIDEETTSILKNAIVVLNMAHNPESHQRYVAWMKASIVGPNGTADPYAAEHRGDWRMSTNNNHYQIDLNRDAFAATQIETENVVEQLHRWNPQVFVDHHGETNEYFFAPYAVPVNLNLPPSTKKWAETFGKNNSAAFDKFGWTYFAREVFDLHYPGYWDSYPALNGAIGMTYETDGGGRKGLRFERSDKTILTFRDGIQHHVVASITTIKTSAENREALLRDFYEFHRSGLQEGNSDTIKEFALVPGEDRGRLADLIDLLLKHRIEVYEARESFTASRAHGHLSGKVERKTFPAGTYLVPLAQPQKRLAKALLEADAQLEEAFLKETREKYAYNKTLGKKVPKERLGFYDVTAWSLPLAYGIEAYGLERPFRGSMQRVTSRPPVTKGVLATNGSANYAYAFSYRTNNGAVLLAQLLKEGYKVAISKKEFYAAGRTFPRGTAIVRVERNPKNVHERIRALADSTEAAVVPLNSAWADKGILLGSRNFVNLKKPKVAVITEEPTRQTSYGAIWYLLEKRYGVPFTALRLAYFDQVDLYRYNVLVLPHGSPAGYRRAFGKKGVERIKEWVKNGGVLVAIKGAAAFAADSEVNLTSARLMGAKPEKPAEGKEKAAGKPEDKKSATKEVKPDFTPGAILRVKLDPRHFLTLGYDDEVPVLVYSDYILKPSKEGANVGLFADKDVRISGFVWEETEKLFPKMAYLIDEPVGRGHVILYADEPIFRLFWRGLERLLLNSILLARSF